MSIEVKAVIDALKAEFGDELVDDLHSVRTAHEWFVRSYGGPARDRHDVRGDDAPDEPGV